MGLLLSKTHLRNEVNPNVMLGHDPTAYALVGPASVTALLSRLRMLRSMGLGSMRRGRRALRHNRTGMRWELAVLHRPGWSALLNVSSLLRFQGTSWMLLHGRLPLLEW